MKSIVDNICNKKLHVVHTVILDSDFPLQHSLTYAVVELASGWLAYDKKR